jgi:hypothetical protein
LLTLGNRYEGSEVTPSTLHFFYCALSLRSGIGEASHTLIYLPEILAGILSVLTINSGLEAGSASLG